MAGGKRKASEVLFETQYHATWSPTPAHRALLEQANTTGGGGLLSRLSLPGLRQLKEKWCGSKLPRSLKNGISLFISPTGEHIALAVHNQITILRREDNYKNPCGIFISKDPQTSFAYGAWSEPQGILGVVDQADRILFIKSNGEEIASTTASQLKLSAPIVSLIVLEDLNAKKSCLCGFCIVTAQGLLHHIEVTSDPSSRIVSLPTLTGQRMPARQLDSNVLCMDYHPGLSLMVFVVVGSSTGYPHDTGRYSLSLWHITENNGLEFLSSTSLVEGMFAISKKYVDSFSTPTVVISPKGSYVATLDVTGRVNIFSLKSDPYSLSLVSFDEREGSQILSLNDVNDVSWWSDHIAVTAKKSGFITMFDVQGGMEVLEEDLQFHTPALGRIVSNEGLVFVLTSYEKSSDNLGWSLISFAERSIQEMYDMLITSQQFQDAVDFADSHGLEKDKVFKAQWLQSDKGIDKINMCLRNIKDQIFVLSECISGGKTEENARALASYGLLLTDQHRFSKLEDEQDNSAWELRKMRLMLLQCRDRLETFLGINMGRFSAQEFKKFRSAPLHLSAVSLAESGKIGALNLLFKRHTYSLASHVLEILSAIPETISVESYGQLLPGKYPPSVILRDEDWVECEKMASFLQSGSYDVVSLGTEMILKRCLGLFWPQEDELSEWYKNRARNIDNFSGQIDNALSLINLGSRRGIVDLQNFLEDISYLHQLIYSTDEETALSMSLMAWENLSDYEKFKVMLEGTKAETVVKRLREIALPFMRNLPQNGYSFLVKWLKGMASENHMDICLAVIEEGCKDLHSGSLFRDEREAIKVTVDCIYLCTLTDQWNTLASMLSKLPFKNQKEKAPFPNREKLTSQEFEEPSVDSVDTLRKRVIITEGHVEVGKLLAYYQVPKPMSFFLDAQLDEKNVKQLLRLIMSKFGRRQPVRSDNDWASMWRDIVCFQEKAFHFLEPEYMLMEFCRGLLKAGKFSLARNYLKGTASTDLAPEKAENIVIQSAREYFFSASSLSSSEIWKARECLSLLPGSDGVKAELGIIDALTIKLPSLGVNLLPMQYKQVRNPMEIINMVIRGQTGAYLNLDELIETAQLLGLTSEDDMSSIQEAAAREAAVTGDLQVSFDLCHLLMKKGHGPIWDLCATIARGPALDNMDINARRQLLGFSLSHCDVESIGELLHAWKEVDLKVHCEKLTVLTGTSPSDLHGGSDYHQQYKSIDNILQVIGQGSGSDLPGSLQEKGKLLSFATLYLPWLVELTKKESSTIGDNPPSESWHMPVRMQAVLCILTWLAINEIAPNDDLIACLAKSMLEASTSEQGDAIGCSFLLNLADDLRGAEVIEEQIATRKGHRELNSIMNMGMTYSSLQSAAVGCSDPSQRKMLLLHKFKEKYSSLGAGEMEGADKVQSSFWKAWKLKLEEQKELTDRRRRIEQIIPGVDSSRFLSGDINHIEEVILSLVDSVKLKKAHILKSAIELADAYGVQRSKVLLRYLGCALLSDHWSNDEIFTEVLDYREDVVASAKGVVTVISSVVYPQLDGRDKQRLCYIYNHLCACCRHLKQTGDQVLLMKEYSEHAHPLDIAQFLKLLEQECTRVSFIQDLDFKNIARLDSLNVDHFNAEVRRHVSDSSVVALGEMVSNLLNAVAEPERQRLMSRQSVYKYHVRRHLAALESKSQRHDGQTGAQQFFNEVEVSYNICRDFIKELPRDDILEIVGSYRMLYLYLPDESAPKSLLLSLLTFWVKLADDVEEFLSSEAAERERLSACLRALTLLVEVDEVPVDRGWRAVSLYGKLGLSSGWVEESSHLFRAMAFAGCNFKVISRTFSGKNISQLYTSTIESTLSDFDRGSDDGANLVNLLSSLSENRAGDVNVLNAVRQQVWEKLIAFSDDLQKPSRIRVFSLQMMEGITGKNGRDARTWQGWNEPLHAEAPGQGDGSRNFSGTLVALKSAHLFSSVLPGVEITPEDVKTIESAVSCFSRLAEHASSEAHLSTLQGILEEWEGFFSDGRPVKESNFVADDWDEGWEDLPEELTPEEETDSAPSSISSLHCCWMLIMRRLVEISKLRGVIDLLDGSLSKPYGTLLTEDEAQSLLQLVDERDSFAGLKMALLLPYRVLWLQSLSRIEDKLIKLGDPSKQGSDDEELLSLALSSGVLPSIASDPCYQRVFAYLCCSAGLLSRVCQEAMARDGGRESGAFSLFGRLLFPFFIAELSKAGQLLLAGFMVAQWMRTHPCFSFAGTVEVTLRKYLEAQSQRLRQLSDADLRELGSFKSLSSTVSSMKVKTGESIQSALAVISLETRRT